MTRWGAISCAVMLIAGCGADGCALERVQPGGGEMPLRAVWGDGLQTVIAVGDNLIVERRAACVEDLCW